MISNEMKAVFVHIPKCAGTSIEIALGGLPPNPPRGWQDHRTLADHQRLTPARLPTRRGAEVLLRRLRLRRHPNPGTRRTLDDDEFRSYFKFTVVRNPWTRALSFFRAGSAFGADRGGLAERYAAFLRAEAGHGHFRPQMHWLRDLDGAVSLDRICRFETLAQDFAEVASRLKLQAVLPHSLDRDSGRLIGIYSPETVDLVARIFAEDISAFGYAFPASAT